MLLINDLKRHNCQLLSELAAVFDDVVKGGWYVLGSNVQAFESEFAEYCQTEHCVSLANGTDALELALRALGVGKGDTVLTVANAGAYSTTAIFSIGARPAYVDVNPDNLLMSMEDLRRIVNGGFKAIIVTHLYGQAAKVDELVNFAEEYGIPVIEDCAQAHGAFSNGRRVGSFGAIGCFSFYPTKNLGALGDGGAIVTNDVELANRVRMLRQYGWRKKYEITLSGATNSRLDELQAAVLRAKLPYLDRWNSRRVGIARRYVSGIKHQAVRTPRIDLDEYVGHLFVVMSPLRDQLCSHLRRIGILTEVHYPIPDHTQPAISHLFEGVALPVTERVCSEVLTLPCFPEMDDSEVQSVIDGVNGWVPT